uniref:NADH-ubiquinone oxidoreductase chain 2 n=1 Tax=Microgale parvula TaxID=1548216 RepID=A0A7G3HVY1_9EUTH|nr:NADH dehydrogenase subunit 2 [Microgale parvula]QCT05187.1 NADH dehydrogenase subunit 2 [Microgale parvula]QCT05188.1 NADH dehydrogenase subunit 2 [Microgale parvula]QCT05189.1 NADH dehydrogenase subunit 2 [Microgale parvula]QCT05190.1 NADH dehydrogenase subunit 2 [Microgale parvula]
MNPIITLIIYTTLITGTMTTMVSSHWLLTWMGLEMNMFAIIPLIMKTHSPRSIEAATKYFLIQASASMILLMAASLNFMNSGQWTMTNIDSQVASALLLIALMMKLGMAPFHFWVPEVTQGTQLFTGLIILTWQKLAPLSIMYQITPSLDPNIMLTSAILSILIGGWGGLNQTQLRKIMAYSSIAHMGWMAAVLLFNPSLMLLNLLMYIIFTLATFTIMMNCLTSSTSTLSMAWNNFPFLVTMLLTVLMSMGGLPPLSGFIPKWLIIDELIKNNNIALAMTMATMALLNLYFYMRLIYASSLTLFPSSNNIKFKWKISTPHKTLLLPTILTLSSLMIPITPMIYIIN